MILPVVDGYIDLYNDSVGSETQLVLDVNGYFSSSGGASSSGSDFNSQPPSGSWTRGQARAMDMPARPSNPVGS